MFTPRHSRRLRRARLVAATAAVMVLAVPATPATAAPPPSPAALTSTTSPVLAASAGNGSSSRAVWRRRRAAVRFARRQLGKPYRWGGTGPNGYDCSGLTRAAWARGGKSLPHSSRQQARITRRVPRGKMRIGDLLFFGNPVRHVAIYVGKGKMIEAPRSGLNVRTVSANRRDRVKIGRP